MANTGQSAAIGMGEQGLGELGNEGAGGDLGRGLALAVQILIVAGRPGAAAANVAGTAGLALTSYSGQIPFSNPVSGNTYLARMSATVNVGGTLVLCDRLWHNSGLSAVSNTLQSFTSAAWPARDMDGSTDGRGVRIGLEVATVMGAGTPTFKLDYTNSAGDTGHTITTAAQATTMAVGSFIPIELAAGDVGVFLVNCRSGQNRGTGCGNTTPAGLGQKGTTIHMVLPCVTACCNSWL